MRNLLRIWFGLAVLLFGVQPARTQEPAAVRRVTLPSLDSQVGARLIALDRRLESTHAPHLAASIAGQLACPGMPAEVFAPLLADTRSQEVWEQLPDEYYRMMQESGDALVSLPDSAGVAWSSGQVRRLCQQRLAALPRASLAAYRQRVDAEARALFEQGRRTRSPIPLRRLVDDLFCSTPGDVTLDLLGDLAFERGQFDEARHWWSLLTPLDGVRDGRLLFPGPKVDLVRVEAKQILALIFQGRLDEARDAIAGLERRHPQAKGQLAGHDGRYGVILRQSLDTFNKERFANLQQPWTTFGGNARHNQWLGGALAPRVHVDSRSESSTNIGLSSKLWEDGPAWRVQLPSLDLPGKDSRSSPRRRAAFHPVIVNNQVLIADHQSVVSYHLTTGKELFRYDLKTVGLSEIGPGIDARIRLPRFTLSVDHDRAYVRLGRPGFGPKLNNPSFLVCLDLTQPETNKRRELWHVAATAEDKSVVAFEGTPLVRDGRVYIALSKLVGQRVVTSIDCYDVMGRQRWTREVCDCPEFEDNGGEPRYRQHLLTWAGGQVAYSSHSGAIVAVDAATGQPTWGVRYPSRGPLTADQAPSPRDLAPCVYADGRVFAAPLDVDRVFCLDSVTGRVQWELDGIEVVHLVGVAHGRLIATTRSGAVSIDAATGNADWMQPSEGRLASLGRGLLVGNAFLWPTADPKLPYRALSIATGLQVVDPTMLHTLPVGNLAFGHGCLAIAGLDEMFVYVPTHLMNDLPPDRRPEARLRLKLDTRFRGLVSNNP